MSRRAHLLHCLALALTLCAIATAAGAGQVYRWTDARGIVHYDGKRPALPDHDVTTLPFVAEPGAPARLRLERIDDRGDDRGSEDGGYLAIAENALAGPIEVMLYQDATDGTRNRVVLIGEPALPARATVPAGGSTVVSRLHAAESSRGGRFAVRLETVPGSPNAKPQDYEYAYPLQTTVVRVEQSWGGAFSHTDAENHFAVDLAADIGTPVLAARDGVVMQVESDFDRASLSAERFGGRANFVRILHDDGSMAIYAHLQLEGALVRIGQRVRRGQVIGLSGNTGFTSGPHLHFAIQVNRGMRLESIPFRMFTQRGILRLSEAH